MSSENASDAAQECQRHTDFKGVITLATANPNPPQNPTSGARPSRYGSPARRTCAIRTCVHAGLPLPPTRPGMNPQDHGAAALRRVPRGQGQGEAGKEGDEGVQAIGASGRPTICGDTRAPRSVTGAVWRRGIGNPKGGIPKTPPVRVCGARSTKHGKGIEMSNEVLGDWLRGRNKPPHAVLCGRCGIRRESLLWRNS